jgi:hypothetical protein
MKLIYTIIVIILISACKDEVEIKPINESDLIPINENVKTVDSTIDKINFRDTLSPIYLSITDSIGFPCDSVTPIFKKPFLARFGALKNQSFVSHFGSDSLQFSEFTFKDSIKTKTAFYNWLDRFADKEIQIKIGEELNVSKQHILVLVSDFTIISFQSSKKLNVNTILAKYKKTEWKFVIEQVKNAKTSWYSIKKKVKTIIKPENNERITVIE